MIESYSRGIYTAIPATVVSFDSSTQRASVEIDILEQIGDKMEKIAVLEDVPIAFPRSGGFVITFPIIKGDKVQLIFQSRSIDKWLIDGASDQKDIRTHNINDSIASNLIAYPINAKIKKFDNKAIVIRNLSNSIYIKVRDENIEIKGDIKIQGDVKIEGKLKATDTITGSDCIAGGVSLKGHVHSGVKAGDSSTGGPM